MMVHPFVTYYIQGLIAYGVLLLAGGGVLQICRKKNKSGVILLSMCAFLVISTVAVRILRQGP